MKYKEARKIVEKFFMDDNIVVEFGWKNRIYPRLRKQMKSWSNQVLEDKRSEKIVV